MNINHILLLIAVLNLSGDLYNIMRLRPHLPRWIMWGNLSAFSVCLAAWLFAPENAGFIAITALFVYVGTVRLYARRRSPEAPLPSSATKLIIIANVVTFVIQYVNHATDNARGFIKLGAVYTPLLEQGEWWRVFTAQFLHWGHLHLAFNMLGLWLLGRNVEAIIGFSRFIALYLLCGAGGMVIAWQIASLTSPGDPMILLGASASVLGLVGTQAAIALLAYRRTGNIAAKAQLGSMTQIVALQAIFDMMVPEVSSTAHIGGAAVGFVLAYGYFQRKLRARSSEA